MKNLRKGYFKQNYPVSKLTQSLVNRDIIEAHCDRFSKKLEEYGWLSPVIIDDKGN